MIMSTCVISLIQRRVLEQERDTLSVVSTTDCFRELPIEVRVAQLMLRLLGKNLPSG